MTAEEKVARQRLSVLELAQAHGNVSEACRQSGVSRPQFYEYSYNLQLRSAVNIFKFTSKSVSRWLVSSMSIAAVPCSEAQSARLPVYTPLLH